jgi:hypothetical protein
MMPHERLASTYTGTGAALSVTCGFRPTFLWVYNATDKDTVAFVVDGQADGTTPNIVLATGEVASQGITLTSTGFSLGTDAVANETGKTFRFFAMN